MLLSSLPQELLGLLLITTSFNVRRVEASPSVNVALQASFDAPPYILELLFVLSIHSIRAKYGG